MNELSLLFRYALRLLLVAGPVEFLLGRTLSRVSGMLTAGPVADAINGLVGFGLSLIEPLHVLTAVTLALAALWPWLRPNSPIARSGAPLTAATLRNPQSAIRNPQSTLAWPRVLTPLIAVFLLASLVLILLTTSVQASNALLDPLGLIIGFNLISAVLVVGLAGYFARRANAPPLLRVALGWLGLAFAGYYVYVIGADLAQMPETWSGTVGDWAVAAHAAGEVCAVLWTGALFVALGPFGPRGATRPPLSWPRLIIAAIPAVAIAMAPLFETWLQGVLVRMSLGFALFLPPPVYALAAFAYVYAALTCWDRRASAQLGIPWLRELGAGLILLPVAGFDLLLNYQLTMAALVLLLLTGLVRPLSLPVPLPAANPLPAVPGPAAEHESSPKTIA